MLFRCLLPRLHLLPQPTTLRTVRLAWDLHPNVYEVSRNEAICRNNLDEILGVTSGMSIVRLLLLELISRPLTERLLWLKGLLTSVPGEGKVWSVPSRQCTVPRQSCQVVVGLRRGPSRLLWHSGRLRCGR